MPSKEYWSPNVVGYFDSHFHPSLKFAVTDSDLISELNTAVTLFRGNSI